MLTFFVVHQLKNKSLKTVELKLFSHTAFTENFGANIFKTKVGQKSPIRGYPTEICHESRYFAKNSRFIRNLDQVLSNRGFCGLV